MRHFVNQIKLSWPEFLADFDLEADESAAMDQSNIINSRTRGAAKPSGTYQEPGDEEVRSVVHLTHPKLTTVSTGSSKR